MINAKTEFLQHIETREVKCAEISTGVEWLEEEKKYYRLPIDYRTEQYAEFVDSLNFNYDSGYGGQELFGTIWYADGTWSERGEYDGSEWWEHRECPAVPDVLHQRTES